MKPSRYVAVCGASDPAPGQRELAREEGPRVVALDTGALEDLDVAGSAEEAVRIALA
jgi:hypothetical protein